MSKQTSEPALSSYLAAIEQTVWDLAHKKEELASAKAQSAALLTASRRLEEDFRRHEAEASVYLTSLEDNLAHAEGWVAVLQDKVAASRLQRRERKDRFSYSQKIFNVITGRPKE